MVLRGTAQVTSEGDQRCLSDHSLCTEIPKISLCFPLHARVNISVTSCQITSLYFLHVLILVLKPTFDKAPLNKSSVSQSIHWI